MTSPFLQPVTHLAGKADSLLSQVPYSSPITLAQYPQPILHPSPPSLMRVEVGEWGPHDLKWPGGGETETVSYVVTTLTSIPAVAYLTDHRNLGKLYNSVSSSYVNKRQ